MRKGVLPAEGELAQIAVQADHRRASEEAAALLAGAGIPGLKPDSRMKKAFRLLPRSSVPRRPQRLPVSSPSVICHLLLPAAFSWVEKRIVVSIRPYRVTPDCCANAGHAALPRISRAAAFFILIFLRLAFAIYWISIAIY